MFRHLIRFTFPGFSGFSFGWTLAATLGIAAIVFVCLVLSGCQPADEGIRDEATVEEQPSLIQQLREKWGTSVQDMQYDDSARPVRFVIDHSGWPRPFTWPTVNEFVVASEQDELMWHIVCEQPDGQPARNLAILYGQVPQGFAQTFPEEERKPRDLIPGRNYFAAAGGESAVYRLIFALPVTATRPRDQADEPFSDLPARRE